MMEVWTYIALGQELSHLQGILLDLSSLSISSMLRICESRLVTVRTYLDTTWQIDTRQHQSRVLSSVRIHLPSRRSDLDDPAND